jgi:hypothetical protein
LIIVTSGASLGFAKAGILNPKGGPVGRPLHADVAACVAYLRLHRVTHAKVAPNADAGRAGRITRRDEEDGMETIEVISLMLGAAWASGINLYAAVLVLGWLGNAGHVELPPGLEIVGEPMVMLAAGAMYAVEFFTDKIPGVDTGWDALHTFIRIPAGAVLAAGAAQGLEMGQAAELAALLVGGGVATASHATKAGSRVLINTSPEPFSNWGASVAEDVTVVAGLWTALNHPWLFIVLLVLFLALVAWLLPKILRAIRRAARALRRWLGGRDEAGGAAMPDGTRRANTLRELYAPQAGDKPDGETRA